MREGVTVPAGRLDLVLDDGERAEFERVAGRLALTGERLVDDRAWLAGARELTCGLPLRLRQVLRRFRHDPGAEGVVTLRNLPLEGAAGLPVTPTVPESVERSATPAASAAVLISLQLGELVAYRAEKSGALVQNVVPVPGREESQSNSGSIPLELHVENAFHPHRPDYVGLLCLRNDHSGTAGTLVSSVRRAVPLLDEAERAALFRPRFVTEAPASFASGAGTTGPHAVLDGTPEDPNVRVDFLTTSAFDDEGKQAIEALRTAFLQVSAALVLQPGEMAFVDNRVAIHGRTAFAPRYDGRDRWLHRTFVHLDGRRALGRRVDGGPVLV